MTTQPAPPVEVVGRPGGHSGSAGPGRGRPVPLDDRSRRTANTRSPCWVAESPHSRLSVSVQHRWMFMRLDAPSREQETPMMLATPPWGQPPKGRPQPPAPLWDPNTSSGAGCGTPCTSTFQSWSTSNRSTALNSQPQPPRSRPPRQQVGQLEAQLSQEWCITDLWESELEVWDGGPALPQARHRTP